MTINEAADRLGLAPSTLRHQIRNGKLKVRRMGGRNYVSDDEVRRYLAENRRKGVSDVAQ